MTFKLNLFVFAHRVCGLQTLFYQWPQGGHFYIWSLRFCKTWSVYLSLRAPLSWRKVTGIKLVFTIKKTIKSWVNHKTEVRFKTSANLRFLESCPLAECTAIQMWFCSILSATSWCVGSVWKAGHFQLLPVWLGLWRLRVNMKVLRLWQNYEITYKCKCKIPQCL